MREPNAYKWYKYNDNVLYTIMAYGRSKTRSVRKRTSRPRTASKSTKKGLTKKEKSQTRKIAKSVVNNLAESKYFNVARSIGELNLNTAWWASATSQSEIGVLGFTTGFEKEVNQDGATVAYKYGDNVTNGSGQNMESLELNRVFEISSQSPLEQNAVEGNTIRPAYAESNWLLNRLAGNTEQINDLANGCTYKVRMIRCKPRVVKGSFQRVHPENDLFLDQANHEFGISSVQNNVRVFNPYELMLAKANSRKYQIIEDTMFAMGPAGNYVDVGLGAGEVAYNMKNPESTACKTLKRTHKIGKELYYNKPNDTSTSQNQYPQDGFQQEFILFHVWASGNPQQVTTARTAPQLMRISCRPVSTFKDI